MISVLIQRGGWFGHRDRDIRRQLLSVKAEIGVMYFQAKKHQRLPASQQVLRKRGLE